MPTIRTLLVDAAAKCPDREFVRWKANHVWHNWTFRELLKQTRIVSEMLSLLKLKPGDRVAVVMENRAEWMSAYLGIACCGLTVVPVDYRLQAVELSHILRDSETKAVFASAPVWTVLREIEADLRTLESIVMLDGIVTAQFKDNGVVHCDFSTLAVQVENRAKDAESFFNRTGPDEETPASIIYTSGTTGRSKGAILSHRNFCSQIRALEFFQVKPEDNFLLVLPLYHAFAFSACFVVPLAARCSVSMVENMRTIPENMRETQPTVLLAVPLLAEKMMNAIQRKLSKNLLAKTMLSIGLGKAVGRKIIDNLGGRLRLLICGGAASDIKMLKKWARLGIATLEGYGLTETSPICAVNPQDRIRLGTVGPVLPGNELRIADPNEEGVGEIEVRGPCVMKGYFRNENATKEAFDNGWFRTGDLGKLDGQGYLMITGRKKNMIVNREGKNIYPEEVESYLSNCPHILESLVLGYHIEEEGKGEHVGCMLVANMERFEEERKAGSSSPLTDEEIRDICLAEAREALRGIATYKHPRKIVVKFEPFQKTQTLKIKRFLYSLD